MYQRHGVSVRNRVALGVEQFESREVPATITVNTVSDADARDNVISLREAIKIADGDLNINQH